MEKKCPYCGAETRPGDNYCLNCGNPLLPATPSSAPQQGQLGDATVAAPADWASSVPAETPQANMWGDIGGTTVAAESAAELATQKADYPAPTAQATIDRIEHPARFILRSDDGEVVQEYPLDKAEIRIGRAPDSDILLSKDKLTSRRHATVRYEDNQYILQDERSANGTFINGQQIEEMVPQVLHDGDHIGIGEHELIFRSYDSPAENIENLNTVAVPFSAVPLENTFGTRQDDNATVATSQDEDFRTREAVEPEIPSTPEPAAPSAPVSSQPPAVTTQPEPLSALPAMTSYQYEPAAQNEHVPSTPAGSYEQADPPAHFGNISGDITLGRLNSLPQPVLPDMTALVAALATLDGQITSLQQQFDATQEAMRQHDSEIAQVTGQLRANLRRVSDRMDSTIADVARSREVLAWAELSQLIEDAMNNPRDIEYVTKLARKARDINKVFQIHQNVLNTMAECNSLLRRLIGEEK
jgi:pSer/pThr/pTyr-binding forkhead associated (FHA) protein